MRKFSALAVVSLLALTGCAAPTVAESAPATVTVTATPEAQTQAVSEAPAPGAQRELTKSEFDRNMRTIQKEMVGFGVSSKELPEGKMIAEINKVCAQSLAYEGLPISNPSNSQSAAFRALADDLFC